MGHPQEQQQSSGLARAVTVAGGQSALAKAIGVKQGHVWDWLNTQDVPTLRCLAIEAATGVRCEELRPDVFWVRDGADVVGIVDSINTDITPEYVAQCIRNQGASAVAAPHAAPGPFSAEGNSVGDRVAAILLTDLSKSTEGLHRHTGIEHGVLKDMFAGLAEPIPGSKRAKSIAEYLGVREKWLVTGMAPVFAAVTGRQQGSALDASAMAKPRPSTVAPVSAEPMVFLVDHGTTVDQCLSVAAQLFQQTEDIFEHECEDFSASTYGAWQLMRFGVRLVADAHLKLIAFEKGLPE